MSTDPRGRSSPSAEPGQARDWARVLRRDPRPPAAPPQPQDGDRTSTPLTDPRSLGSSLVFHAMLLVVVSVAALSVRVQAVPEETPAALRGELGPVDNRVPNESGGGSPGDLGATSTVQMAADGRSAESQALRDPTADALLSEILPAPASADASQRALPGPLTTGMGILPGPGTGGGGGSGGGSGGGIGRGIGPGTEFFGAREHAGSYAYVIDCSGSMAVHKSLEVAKRELLASLTRLPPDAQFGIVFYNLNATVFTDATGRPGLMQATASNKARTQTQLARMLPDGGTNHMTALRTALSLHAEAIFFLTDADLMTNKDVDEILGSTAGTRIQAIEFGLGPSLNENTPLRRLATSTGGTYRYIDVTRFSKQ